jgi:perosamine synthetase
MMRVPVNEPVITPEAKQFVLQALDSGWVSSAGPFIDQFEQEFATYIGVRNAVSVTSGTAALHIALLSLGVGPGDEVIVPDFTMIASVFAVLYTGATPVFADIEHDTYNMDVARLRELITPKTKAIMPVHIYGHSVDMDPLLELASEKGIAVVEDAAEAHGALYKGRKCGSMGRMSCFSFYANKIVTTGEGGMILTDDDALAAKARGLKDLAHVPGHRFTHKEVGYNYRMTNLQAALGLGQLRHIEDFLAHKRWMTAQYEKRLAGIPGLRLPVTKPYASNVYWMYSILLEEGFPLSRDELRGALKEKGVDTRDFFPSSAQQPVVRRMMPTVGRCPISEDVAARGLYLPSGLSLTEEQIAYVCDSLRSSIHA